MKGRIEMALRRAFLRDSELDQSSYPEFRDQVSDYEQAANVPQPRSYPGYPKVKLARIHTRPLAALERSLVGRRCLRRLGVELPTKRTLSRLLQFAHGVCAGEGRGPVPSAGGLQALELYMVVFEEAWLQAGVHHYDRAGHHVSRVEGRAHRGLWRDRVPSMDLVEGGALEAGHLMQNLCLLSASLGLSTVPMGGVLEPEIGRELALPESDAVLYAGLCG
jgi:hypothetical protein